jgi:hypothetical protein
MSVTNALKGAVADARPLQNPDFRRLWVITMIGAQLTARAARRFGSSISGRGRAATQLGVEPHQRQSASPCRPARTSRPSSACSVTRKRP